MGKQFTLSASDSFKLGAYRADPAGTPKGGIVVIQEIFGVNQTSARRATTSPGRLRRGGAGLVRPHAEGFPVRLHAAGNREGAHLRRQARLGCDDARHRSGDERADAVGPVGIIGFCMGGTIAFLGATRLSGLSAAVGYYGGRIAAFADEKPSARRSFTSARRMPASR